MKNNKGKSLVTKVCLVLAASGVPFLVGAQESTPAEEFALNPYVVTATRTETKLLKTPANVTVVQGDEIRAKNESDVSAVLRNVPGVDIRNYGTGVGYTNTNALYINGSSNVVYMVDGVVMNSAGINPAFITLKNMNNIDRIEVVKGAASALYGTGAVGGVVNIITRKPKEGVTSKVRVTGGSYDQEQYSFANEGYHNGWFWRASYQKDIMGDYKDAEGLKIPQHLNARTESFMLGREIDTNNTLTLYHDTYRSNEFYSDSNRNLTNIYNGRAAIDSTRAVLQSKIGNNVSNTLSFLNTRYNTRYGSNYGDSINDVQTRSIADQLSYQEGGHTVIGGFEWRQDKVNNMNSRKLTNMSYYVQDAWKFAPKWTVTPGIRLDHHSSFGTQTSPHISLGYDPNDATNVYLSFNSYFVAPTPFQLFDSVYGNDGLKPETGHAWELGMTHMFNSTTTGGLHIFTRTSKDKIAFNYATSKYYNFDEEKARGVSLDLAKQFTPEFSGRIGYTYTHVNAAPGGTSNINGYIPKHSVVMGLDYVKTKWDVHLDVRGIIDRPGPDSTGTNGAIFPKKTYWITDVSANYRINDNIAIFGKVGNLFNVFYAEQSNVAYGSPGDWWAAPGRNFQAGMEFTF